MLGTEPMSKVRLVVLDERKQAVVAALHDMGIIDFRKSALVLSDDQPMGHFVELSDLIIKFEGALKILPKTSFEYKEHMPLDRLLKTAAETDVVDRAYALDAERKELNEERRILEHAYHVAFMLDGMDMSFGELRSDVLAFRAFETEPVALEKLGKEIRDRNIQAVVEYRVKGPNIAAGLLAYEKSVRIDELLKGYKLKELDLGAKYLEGRPGKALADITAKVARNRERISRIEEEIRAMGERSYAHLANIRMMLKAELDRANASSIFKKTDKTTVIEGWIEAKRVPEFKARMAQVTDGVFHIEEVEDKELAPTLVHRPKFLKGFDYMMEFFSVPRSDEIDPTWIFIVSLPIFYGLMVTDVGYGVMSFLLASYVTKITDPDGLVWNAAQIWKIGAVSAIFFGFITNQYFGLALNQYFLPFHGIDWVKNITYFEMVSILFGLTQLTAGLLLGFVNKWRRGNKKLAISRLTSAVTLVCGAIFCGGFFFKAFSMAATVDGGIIAAIGLVATMVLSGEEAVEVTSLIAHPLSYSRIMGFGLVSVVLAMLIDKGFTPTMSHGIVLFIVYSAIFIVLHTANMIVSIFEGIVQGIRLNFVEFYTKFYEGGGVKFRPFSYIRYRAKK